MTWKLRRKGSKCEGEEEGKDDSESCFGAAFSLGLGLIYLRPAHAQNVFRVHLEMYHYTYTDTYSHRHPHIYTLRHTHTHIHMTIQIQRDTHTYI